MYWPSSVYYIEYAFVLSCIFVFSLFFGLAMFLIHVFTPRGDHRIHRGDR